jgi:two-component system, cell cycle response regulator
VPPRWRQPSLRGQDCVIAPFCSCSPVPIKGAVFQLHGTSIWIGRGPNADVDLDDDDVSSAHAHVTRRADGFYLQDGGSRSGTILNDQRLELPRRLVDGDHLVLGNTVLKFSMLDELEEHALTALFELTIRDPLTHAYNRRYLNTHLRSELAFAARQGVPLSVLLVDIDHFKRVNDSYGHRAGDVILQLVAATIARILRPYDVICRYGGEEFVVVARDTSHRNAQILAERIRHQVEGLRFELGGSPASVTVSIGVTTVSPQSKGLAIGPLLQAADDAMYAAKKAGRNCVRTLHAPMSPNGEHSQLDTSPPSDDDELRQGAADRCELECRQPARPRFD